MHPFFDIRPPHLFAHRGASAEAPENTLPAFARAIEHGVRYLELDCHATRDGEIVVLHDAELERTTNGEGPVSAYTYAELQRIDAGYRFSPDGHAFPFRGSGVRVPGTGLDRLSAFTFWLSTSPAAATLPDICPPSDAEASTLSVLAAPPSFVGATASPVGVGQGMSSVCPA